MFYQKREFQFGSGTKENSSENNMADTVDGLDVNSDCENSVNRFHQITNSSVVTPTTVKSNMVLTKKIARELAGDIVYYRCSDDFYKPPVNQYAKTMRRTVDEISVKHEILFNSMVNKLNVDHDNGLQTFINVVEEMFRDGFYNWGRIVTVYAFGARLARYCVEAGMAESVQFIAEYVGSYVSDKLTPWISSQGGWEMFLQYFPDNNLENTLWKGLLATFVGLGALATVVAAR